MASFFDEGVWQQSRNENWPVHGNQHHISNRLIFFCLTFFLTEEDGEGLSRAELTGNWPVHGEQL